MAFDMDSVNQQMSSGMDSIGNQISSSMAQEGSGQDLSEQDMLKLQYNMQRWSMMVNMQSNIQKTYGDALKSVVSNMR